MKINPAWSAQIRDQIRDQMKQVMHEFAAGYRTCWVNNDPNTPWGAQLEHWVWNYDGWYDVVAEAVTPATFNTFRKYWDDLDLPPDDETRKVISTVMGKGYDK